MPGIPTTLGRRLVPKAFAIDALQAQLVAERSRRQRLEGQLRNLADHDPVTNLLSRRSMEDELEGHLARCARYGPEGALLLVGVDGLHDPEAELDQQDADEWLANLAEILVRRLRATDVVGRWESDQLAVIVPRGQGSGVAVVAETVGQIVGSAGTERVPAGRLTAFVGMAPVVEGSMASGPLKDLAARSMLGRSSDAP